MGMILLYFAGAGVALGFMYCCYQLASESDRLDELAADLEYEKRKREGTLPPGL